MRSTLETRSYVSDVRYSDISHRLSTTSTLFRERHAYIFISLCLYSAFLCVCPLSDTTCHHVYVCMNAERESVLLVFFCTSKTYTSEASSCITRLTVECISHRDDWSPSHSNLLLVSLFPIRVLLVLLAPTDLHLC